MVRCGGIELSYRRRWLKTNLFLLVVLPFFFSQVSPLATYPTVKHAIKNYKITKLDEPKLQKLQNWMNHFLIAFYHLTYNVYICSTPVKWSTKTVIKHIGKFCLKPLSMLSLANARWRVVKKTTKCIHLKFSNSLPFFVVLCLLLPG